MRESDPEYFTPREVADLFRVDIATVARWAREWEQTGEVKVIRTPGGHNPPRRFLSADIRRLREDG